MPYAANGEISQEPLEGGVEITSGRYQEILAAKLKGDDVRVVDGVTEIYIPSRERVTYWLAPVDEHQTEPGEEPPEGAALTPPPDGYHVVEEGAWVYSLERECESMTLTMYQAEAALLDAGLLDDVEALMDDPGTSRRVQIMWKRKDRIRRTHPTTIEMATALGWTDEQLDDLFRAGREIEP